MIDADKTHTIPPKRPVVIGIAGGIGSGKSAVAAILADFGCVVSSADQVVRDLLDNDPAIHKTLVDWWGAQVLDDNGDINRSAIAKIVFNDPDARLRLEQLLHPIVEQCRIVQWDNALTTHADIPGFVIDAPLLFEAGLNQICDVIIFVDVDLNVRLERIRTRGWDAAELQRREKSQTTLDIKQQQSDYIVRNNGHLDDLKQEIKRVFHHILTDWHSRSDSPNNQS